MQNKKILKIGAILDTISTRKDGSIKLVFETQEINTENGTAAISMRNQFGWLVFMPNADEAVIPNEPAPNFQDERTPSQRFRSVLFLRWKQFSEENRPSDFNTYYRQRMEALIEREKELLK